MCAWSRGKCLYTMHFASICIRTSLRNFKIYFHFIAKAFSFFFAVYIFEFNAVHVFGFFLFVFLFLNVVVLYVSMLFAVACLRPVFPLWGSSTHKTAEFYTHNIAVYTNVYLYVFIFICILCEQFVIVLFWFSRAYIPNVIFWNAVLRRRLLTRCVTVIFFLAVALFLTWLRLSLRSMKNVQLNTIRHILLSVLRN